MGPNTRWGDFGWLAGYCFLGTVISKSICFFLFVFILLDIDFCYNSHIGLELLDSGQELLPQPPE